ncbi:hypothetical protein [Spirosoma areae]
MRQYTILDQQSLFDIAVEVYGDVDAVFWLLEDNPGVGLTDRLQVGQSLNIREAKMNPRQAAELALYSPFQTIDEEDRPEGIDYWLIDDYEVQ